MSSATSKDLTAVDEAHGPVISNTVALIGVILAAVASVLVALLFWVVSQKPDDIATFQEQLGTNTPAQLRLLILGCSAALLMFIAFVLCAVGLVLPNRPRTLAAAGTGITLLLLLGIFGVVVIGTVLNPKPVPGPVQNAPEQPSRPE